MQPDAKMAFKTTGSTYDTHFTAAPCDTYKNGRSEPARTSSSDVQTELTRISCYLAGEIEVPDGVPSWNILHGLDSPLRLMNRFGKQSVTQKSDGTETHSKQLPRVGKRKLEQMNSMNKQAIQRLDIEVPLDWDSCYSRLWDHVTKHSIVNEVLHREPFAKRLQRIAELARKGLRERGFFTMKNFLGPEHATQICQWAWNRRRKQPHLFRPGKLSLNESTSTEIRRDLVAWIHPEIPPPTHPGDSENNALVPYVQLLFLYIDAIVRSLSDCVQNRHGEWAVISGKSWANISSHFKQSDTSKRPVGYVAHYDNPDGLCDGRILTAMYYLNPNWEREWGGQIVIWPRRPRSSPRQSVCSLSPGLCSIISNTGSNTITDSRNTDNNNNDSDQNQFKPLAILPNLDRFVLFYADQRILHCVQPVLDCSPQNERLAIGIWYFDRHEREEYLRSQVAH